MILNIETLFNILNAAILPMWALLIFAPRWAVTQWLIQWQAIPVAIAVGYASIILPNITSISQADFGSLAGIKALFKEAADQFIAAAWFHYLAFDLLVGMMIVQDAAPRRISQWIVAPCLFFTFFLGPVGFLMYYIIKNIWNNKNS